MQIDFHYYATYCAAYLAGYSHAESLDIAYADQMADCFTRTYIEKIKGPKSAATTQSNMEVMDAPMDMLGLRDITRIWSSFHFLPQNLHTPVKGCRNYRDKFHLICGPNGDLVRDLVHYAKGGSLQKIGLAMHTLSDTWAHRGFAGTPSLVINNIDYHFYEYLPDGGRRRVQFRHRPGSPDDIEHGVYTNTIYSPHENTAMNLGHGRAGHIPDYSFMVYEYLPSWADYEVLVKNNPEEYYHAFTQMILALKFLHGEVDDFQVNTYDTEAVAPYKTRIWDILTKRQLDASEDWRAFGESLSGRPVETFYPEKYQKQYLQADDAHKSDTFLGKYILAAMRQKSMITAKIHRSGNLLMGRAIDYQQKGFKGIKDFKALVDYVKERRS